MSDTIDKRLAIVQSRISQYGMRFPVAMIAEHTKLDRGYISSVLNGKKPMSDNFWSKFNKHFPEKSVNKSGENGSNGMLATANPADPITILNQWREDVERKYQDSNRRELALINIINSYLKDMAINLAQGQKELKEQIFVNGEHLAGLLEGLRQGLAAGRVPATLKKDKGIGGQERGNDGKGKVN